MSGKSQIKEQVLNVYLADCLLAADKGELDGRTNGIPRLSASASNSVALQTITSAIDDTGVRMHALSYTPGVFGDTLVDTMLAPVKRFFQEYPHGETYVMRMDIGLFMPEPKRDTQIDHTRGIVQQMERYNIMPIAWSVGDPVPLMIGFNKPLPHWDAVRANRTLFRHACNQLMEMIQQEYRPPRGCRLILDYNVPNASSGIDSLEQWMNSKRIQCSLFARRTIAAARRRFAHIEHWHAQADQLVLELARAGHIKVAPICIETSLDTNVTYAPFVLHNAAHNCGEADVGCLFWIDALQSNKLHITLAGSRVMPADPDAPPQDLAPGPLSVVERRALGLRILENDPDAIILIDDPSSHMARYLTYVLEPDAAATPAMHRNAAGAALVISIDTDFFSLVLLWYAQFCHGKSAARGREYCRAHAPFLSLGEFEVKHSGWLIEADDIVPTSAQEKLPAEEVAALKRCFSIWDIEAVYARVCAMSQHGSELERVASFAMFCAACQNDYLPGFYYVNRRFSYQALLATGVRLVRYEAGKPVVDLANVIEFVKTAYYLSLCSKGKPPMGARSARTISYAQVAQCVATKYGGMPKAHMPDRKALQKLYKRYQWWISMATEAWRDLGAILDYHKWGWPDLK